MTPNILVLLPSGTFYKILHLADFSVFFCQATSTVASVVNLIRSTTVVHQCLQDDRRDPVRRANSSATAETETLVFIRKLHFRQFYGTVCYSPHARI